MGPSMPKPANSSGDKLISDALKERNKEFKRQRVIKMLLYGPGESGKTTILRQMRLIHGESLMEERKQRKGLICLNIIEGAAFTVKAANVKFGIEFRDPETVRFAQLVSDAYSSFVKAGKSVVINLNDTRLALAISYLYGDADFKRALERRSEYQIHDGWIYYAEKLADYPTWGGPDWVPDENDLLHSRIMTTGQNAFNFTLDDIRYQLIDVGGQRSERRKFFSLFSQMDCVLFVASLSEYDQNLFEDENANRLTETINLWASTVNHRDFQRTWFLLFFNKLDLFKEKYYDRQLPIRPKFKPLIKPPKYDEEVNRDCDKALNWFENLFMNAVGENKKHQVRLYRTSALEPDSISRAMNLCTTLLMKQDDIGTYM